MSKSFKKIFESFCQRLIQNKFSLYFSTSTSRSVNQLVCNYDIESVVKINEQKRNLK